MTSPQPPGEDHAPAPTDDRATGPTGERHDPPREHPAPPVTGDAGVDRVLQDLDHRLEAGPDEQVEAVAEAHRQLQARLTTSAQPASPGPARPGPR